MKALNFLTSASTSSIRKTARLAALALILGTAGTAAAQGPWVVDIPDEQIYTNPAATEPKVGIRTDDPSEALEVVGNSLLRGMVGVNTSAPSTQLSVRGQMSMSTIGFSTSTQDKISLYSNRLGQDDMVGFGFETETVIDGGLFASRRVLYNKADYLHRWYVNSNADNGISSVMTLRDDRLGLRVDNPQAGFHLDLPATRDLFRIDQDGTTRFIQQSSGQVGINMDNPLADLHVEGVSTIAQFLLTSNATGSGGDAELLLGEDDDFTFGMAIRYDGGDNRLYFMGQNSTASGPHMSIERDAGDVAIGWGTNAVPAGYKLAVNGAMIAESITVEMSADWPDYVFESDYKMPSLQELSAQIDQLGHLPGIPSAAEIETGGLDLGETQRMMMEKIEELTLYVIDLQNQLDEYKSK